MTSKPKPPTEPRAVHRPLSIRVESVSALPDIRELPQDTQMTINIKMNRETTCEFIYEALQQLGIKVELEVIRKIIEIFGAPKELDFVAITVTGVS